MPATCRPSRSTRRATRPSSAWGRDGRPSTTRPDASAECSTAARSASRTCPYPAPDAAELSINLGELAAAARPPQYADVYDGAGWPLLQPVACGGLVCLSLSAASASSFVASRE